MKHFFTLLTFVLTASGLFGQQLTSVLIENKQNGVLAQYGTEAYEYNADATVRSITTSLVNGQQNKRSFTYDSDGNKISEISEELNEDTQIWDFTSMSVMTYDAAGKLLTQTNSFWTGTWNNGTKTVNIYDASGFLVRVELSIWDAGAWQTDSKFEITNDAQGKALQTIFSRYENNAWVEMSRSNNTYNAQGLMETIVLQDKSGNAWDNQTKNIFTYDGNDLPVENLIQYWIQDEWKTRERHTTTYNTNLTKNVQTWQYLHEGTQQWTDSSRRTYTYAVVVAGTDEENLSAASIYPNPAEDFVFIDFGKPADAVIRVFDLSGKIVRSAVSSGMTHKVSLDGIPSGTYLLETVSGEKSEVSRFVRR